MTTREEVAQWLDQAFADGLPEGLDPQVDPSVDQYALWSAMTSLSQEVRLQGRAFKQLQEDLQARAAEEGRTGNLVREAEQRARREALDLLLDTRDRLQRGLDSLEQHAAAPPWSWWQRWLGHPGVWERARATTQALAEGYRLGLDQLDSQLNRLDVRPLACLNQPFDPHTMRAVQVEVRSQLPDGTVVGVLRAGYVRAGELHRPAQVIVSKKSQTEGAFVCTTP